MKLTKIATAIVAALAMTALVASAASAAEYKSASSPVMLFGEQEGTHVFKVDGQSVTCKKAVFEKASLATPDNKIEGVTASYNECTAFGFAGASVKMNNCTYEFQKPGNEDANGQFTAKVALRCKVANNTNETVVPATVKSSVFGSECEVTIGETGNTELAHVMLKNNGNNVDLNATVNVITVNRLKDNGLCPLKTTGVTTEASYEGKTPVQGTGVKVFVG